MRLFFDNAPEGVFVEVGANEPKLFSQTWHLEARGWRGLLVEPIGDLCERLRRERPQSTVVQAACGRPGGPAEVDLQVTKNPAHSTILGHLEDPTDEVVRTEGVRLATLDGLIEESGLDRVDFVSIDVEGAQLEVLRGFDLRRHRPRLLVIEDHLRNLSLHRFLTGSGYALVKRTGVNSWYVPRDRSFSLTSRREGLALRWKLWRTPFRRLRFEVRRRLGLRT